MKALLKSEAVQSVAAWLFSTWLRLCYATTRWSVENREAADAAWGQPGPVIVCFWHAQISIAAPAWRGRKASEPRVLISRSRDGQFIASTVANLGYRAIRGSSTKTTVDGEKEKGGSAAFRDVLRWLKSGGTFGMTPDGPRGPARQMAEGAPMMAKLSGAPVLLLGLATSACRRLNTWDRTVIPLPFGRGAIVWDGPIRVARDDDAAELAEAWSARLSAATDRAEALVR